MFLAVCRPAVVSLPPFVLGHAAGARPDSTAPALSARGTKPVLACRSQVPSQSPTPFAVRVLSMLDFDWSSLLLAFGVVLVQTQAGHL